MVILEGTPVYVRTKILKKGNLILKEKTLSATETEYLILKIGNYEELKFYDDSKKAHMN